MDDVITHHIEKWSSRIYKWNGLISQCHIHWQH